MVNATIPTRISLPNHHKLWKHTMKTTIDNNRNPSKEKCIRCTEFSYLLKGR